MGDVSLVVSITRGDSDALGEAYARHGPAVHSIARRLCGGVGAEDLVQDIFVALWSRPDRYDPERGSLGAFLSMQVHGRAIDKARSEGARRSREWADALQAVPSNPSPEGPAMTLLVRDELDRALVQIPALEREVIVLAFFGGHTYKEVALMLGQPEGTVKSRIRAGLSRLRDLLADRPAPNEPILAA